MKSSDSVNVAAQWSRIHKGIKHDAAADVMRPFKCPRISSGKIYLPEPESVRIQSKHTSAERASSHSAQQVGVLTRRLLNAAVFPLPPSYLMGCSEYLAASSYSSTREETGQRRASDGNPKLDTSLPSASHHPFIVSLRLNLQQQKPDMIHMFIRKY
ncbi:hypothetical protein ATANTOWER_011208 [Ataeniobius toweri]|uniref:Uncharacterized protein n=1 Tax=Ataeniobius toweri TaxID=208326 RepID=A0ABU7ATU6_9TELE|nr:hypothetical protein [Ataeniobius toweri]